MCQGQMYASPGISNNILAECPPDFPQEPLCLCSTVVLWQWKCRLADLSTKDTLRIVQYKPMLKRFPWTVLQAMKWVQLFRCTVLTVLFFFPEHLLQRYYRSHGSLWDAGNVKVRVCKACSHPQKRWSMSYMHYCLAKNVTLLHVFLERKGWWCRARDSYLEARNQLVNGWTRLPEIALKLASSSRWCRSGIFCLFPPPQSWRILVARANRGEDQMKEKPWLICFPLNLQLGTFNCSMISQTIGFRLRTLPSH